jgi:hypothetical protein
VAPGPAHDVADAKADARCDDQPVRCCDRRFVGRFEQLVYAVAAPSGAPRERSNAIARPGEPERSRVLAKYKQGPRRRTTFV